VKGSRIAVVFAGVVALHLAVAGVVVLTGGCTSKPEVLQNRPYIPAPSMQPAVVADPLAPMPEFATPMALPPAPEVILEPELISYTVKSGDSYWKIARQYGVSHQELIAFNNADAAKPLRVGSTLRIPPGGDLIPANQLPPIKKAAPATAATASGVKPQALPSDGAYTVQKGDSLWLIARKFGTTTKDLAAANGMSVEKPLQVGQKLNIPGGKGPAATAAKPAPAPVPATTKPVSPAIDDLYAPLPGTKPAATADDDIDALLRELDMEDAATPATTPGAAATPGAATPSATTPGTAATPATPAAGQAIDDLVKSAESFSEHQVLPGENLQSVADLYGMKVEDLRQANPGVAADGKLPPFSIIKVPNQ
jgi:LysM repeat protein